MSKLHILHNLSYSSELLAYIVTVGLNVKQKSKVSLLLLCVMSMIIVTETMGKFRAYFPAYSNVFLIQNIEMLVEIFVFLLVYWVSLRNKILQQTVGFLLIIYCLVVVVSICKWQSLYSAFPTYSVVAGGLCILTAIQLYFYEGIKNMHEQRFDKNYLFYISIGLFVFYANEMPVMTLLNHYLKNKTNISQLSFLIDLKLIVSIFFYSIYSFGILWTTRK